MGLGYYEVGGFKTVIDNLSKYLGMYGVEVTVAARVVKINPSKHVNLIRLAPEDFAKEARHYDIVHIHTSYPYTKAAVEDNAKNLVFTWHGYAPTIYVPGIRNKIVNVALKFIYRKYLQRIKYITTISKCGAQQLLGMYNIRARIIPNGVDLEIFKQYNKDDEIHDHYPVVLNVTAYNNFKGRNLLLESFKVILKRYPDALLIAGGSGINFKNIMDPGLLSEDDIVKYYRMANFYLLTSKWESFGLPIIEAFATGTPVIALDKEDARREHVLGSGAGLLFKDEDSLLQAVDEVLSHRNQYSSRGVEYARRFDWGKVAREYVKLYEEIIGDEAGDQ
jgi:glycosyltransferase involved in cell wall biosynthesis